MTILNDKHVAPAAQEARINTLEIRIYARSEQREGESKWAEGGRARGRDARQRTHGVKTNERHP